MYSFEGDFRSRPQQSLGGATRKEPREALLHRATVERQKREDVRKKTSGAIQIQSFVRGSLARIKQKNIHREEFDEILKNSSENLEDEKLAVLVQKLIFFYSNKEDSSRLIGVCQIVLKRTNRVVAWLASDPNKWKFKLVRLLRLCLSHLVELSRMKKPIAIPMRMLEVFTSAKTYERGFSTEQSKTMFHTVIQYLVYHNFFQDLRLLVDEMIPSSIEHSPNPPTVLAGSIFELLMKPILEEPKIKNYEFRTRLFRDLCGSFFCTPFSNQVSEFILPAMSSPSCDFPFEDLVRHLLVENVPRGHLTLTVQPTPWFLYSVLLLAKRRSEFLSISVVWRYLHILRVLASTLSNRENKGSANNDMELEDEAVTNFTGEETSNLHYVVKDCVDLINTPGHVQMLVNAVGERDDKDDQPSLISLSHIGYHLLTYQKHAIHNYRLLYTLAFQPEFLRRLWRTIASTGSKSTFGSSVPLLHLIARGLPPSPEDRDNFVPLLALFCSLQSCFLGSLHDSEFYGDVEYDNKSCNVMPFRLSELAAMGLMLRDVCLGLIELAYPNSRPSVSKEYWDAMLSVGGTDQVAVASIVGNEHTYLWEHLFKVALNLVRQLYARDTRQQFCPKDHWLSKHVVISPDRALDLQARRGGGHYGYRPFDGLCSLSREELERDGPPLSTTKIRNITILRELPFVVPFQHRVMIFQQLILKDRLESQGEMSNFLAGPQIQVIIRRNYIYEDAFEKLSLENEPNLKLKMRVQLVNAVGLDEAGIDGGGICREFLNELLKTSFNPNQGFFKLTHDNLLYPNPNVHLLVDNFTQHYFFIGRMLGKAMYENMLIELPFAGFFLSKLLGRTSANVDIDHLNSLDPLLYKNLLSLKKYDGDVTDLGLDFTVLNNEFGEAKIEELLPGGAKMAVTEANKIKYIHLVADYKLNKQIHAQCNAFKQGLANVVNLECLQMFDWKELQTLISGAQVPIDVSDLEHHTNYSGGYDADHPVIKLFWKAVSTFDDLQRRQLLKFVTSCSRPPLLGFKELFPAFCIQSAGTDERLPTSSTCMNLLKLPEFKDEQTMRAKLLYAIESGSGFELS